MAAAKLSYSQDDYVPIRVHKSLVPHLQDYFGESQMVLSSSKASTAPQQELGEVDIPPADYPYDNPKLDTRFEQDFSPSTKMNPSGAGMAPPKLRSAGPTVETRGDNQWTNEWPTGAVPRGPVNYYGTNPPSNANGNAPTYTPTYWGPGLGNDPVDTNWYDNSGNQLTPPSWNYSSGTSGRVGQGAAADHFGNMNALTSQPSWMSGGGGSPWGLAFGFLRQK